VRLLAGLRCAPALKRYLLEKAAAVGEAVRGGTPDIVTAWLSATDFNRCCAMRGCLPCNRSASTVFGISVQGMVGHGV
jgi:hypothetical protein